jgi:3-oxoacyl-[acyl-carrier-protein] synthase-3
MYLHSLGHFHPENVIDNRFLERLDIGTDDEWIVSRTGIRNRHTVLPLEYICATRNRDPREADEASLYSNAEPGYRAAKMALDRADLAASQVGMVIAGGSAPRMGAPGEACLIAERIGISAPCLDVNAACSTFGVQLRILSMMAAEAAPDFVLLVHPENLVAVLAARVRETARISWRRCDHRLRLWAEPTGSGVPSWPGVV